MICGLFSTKPSFNKNDNEQYRNIILIKTLKKDLFVNEFEIKLRNEMKQAILPENVLNGLKKKHK